jgi:hypothetical protein
MEDNEYEIVEMTNDVPAEINEFTPKQFDYLEDMLFKLNQYQFRHMTDVSTKQFIFWSFVYAVVVTSEAYFFSGFSVFTISKNLLLEILFLGFFIGMLSVASKCITRLYNLKTIGTRVLQALSVLNIALNSKYLLLPLNNLYTGFESFFTFTFILLSSFLFIYILHSYIPFKWLKSANRVYVFSFASIISILLLVPGLKHYVFSDNDVKTYAAVERGIAGDMSQIDSAVDSILEDLK